MATNPTNGPLAGGARPTLPLLGLLAAWAVAAVLGPAAGRAAEAGPTPLTLAEARKLALERNADFRVAQAQVGAALAQLKVAREYPNPTLGLSMAYISTNGAPEGTALGNALFDRAYDSIASLSQLFVVGKRGLMREAATAGVHSAEFQRDDARRLLLQGVTQAYAAALAAREEAEVLADSAGKLRREADIAGHRFHAGDLSASDKAQLEIAADQDELNAEAERAVAKTAVVTLEILLGEPAPAGATPLADTLGQWTGSIPADLGEAPIGFRSYRTLAVTSGTRWRPVRAEPSQPSQHRRRRALPAPDPLGPIRRRDPLREGREGAGPGAARQGAHPGRGRRGGRPRRVPGGLAARQALPGVARAQVG